jgi:hypothetical protein
VKRLTVDEIAKIDAENSRCSWNIPHENHPYDSSCLHKRDRIDGKVSHGACWDASYVRAEALYAALYGEETTDEALPEASRLLLEESGVLDGAGPVRGAGSSPDTGGSVSNPPLTVGQVMKYLNDMKSLHGNDVIVPGLSADSDSYRGYYERLAIEPGSGVKAIDLFVHLNMKLGTIMTGYKGGDFFIGMETLVHVAHWGDTGPKLIDFDDVTPVLEEERW